MGELRRGAMIFVIAGLVFTASDALTKALVAHVAIVDVIWGRHIVYLIAVVAIAGHPHPQHLVDTAQRGLQLVRGLTMFGATATLFLSLALLPLAEVSALSSTTPLITVALAGPLLGERITRAVVVSAAVGFVGVVVLVGFDPGSLNVAAVIPLVTATSYGLFSLATRALRAEDPYATMFYSGAVGLAASTLLLVLVQTEPAPGLVEWAGIALVGLIAMVGHRLIVAAYRGAPASALAPLGYLSIVWAFVVGSVVFSEPIQPQEVVGAAAIAMGGLIALRSPAATTLEVPVSAESGDQVELSHDASR